MVRIWVAILATVYIISKPIYIILINEISNNYLSVFPAQQEINIFDCDLSEWFGHAQFEFYKHLPRYIHSKEILGTVYTCVECKESNLTLILPKRIMPPWLGSLRRKYDNEINGNINLQWIPNISLFSLRDSQRLANCFRWQNIMFLFWAAISSTILTLLLRPEQNMFDNICP